MTEYQPSKNILVRSIEEQILGK